MENYLITIYRFYEKQQDKLKGIRSVEIASELKISKPSVSSMIKKLTNLNYLKSEPYSKIFFTKKGLTYAKKLIHNHRIIEVFLRNILELDVADIHKEAHILEHAFSDKVIKKLNLFLNNPQMSPYRKKISQI